MPPECMMDSDDGSAAASNSGASDGLTEDKDSSGGAGDGAVAAGTGDDDVVKDSKVTLANAASFDVYSLSMVLLAMWTGEEPWSNTPVFKVRPPPLQVPCRCTSLD